MIDTFPKCLKCGKGVLVPLSDTSYEQPRVGIMFRVWACSNPSCDFEISLRSGSVVRGQQPRDQKPH